MHVEYIYNVKTYSWVPNMLFKKFLNSTFNIDLIIILILLL